MCGVEGAIFAPMAFTYAYARLIAILLTVTLAPVMCFLLLNRRIKERRNFVWAAIAAFYHKLFGLILEWPRLTLVLILLFALSGFSLLPRLGGEFLPKLEEGNIWAHAILPTTINLPQGARMANTMRQVLLSFPEVSNVVSQVGRPDDGTESTSFFNVEFAVDLKPAADWPKGMTKARLVNLMDAKLRGRVPGVSFSYSQNIEDNIDEALSGVKAGANAVKVFGYDLATDESVASRVAATLRRVPGVVMFRSLGQPNIVIEPDRVAAYGLNSGDVAAIVQTAIGGQAVTQVLEGDRRFNLVVRWKPSYREAIDAMRNIRVNVPAGGNVPLGQIARVVASEGASFIYRGNLQRYVPISFSVAGRDLQGAVADAKQRVANEIKLPEGIHLEWAGQYGELQAANRRLAVVVRIALILIMGVLFAATQSAVDTFVVMAQIPLACLGGILALYITGTPFSVSAAVGFISIFGIATMDGILLAFYIRKLWDEGHPFREAIVMGSDRRLRAAMMTDLVDAFGLLPMALSTRIGAQTQRPLAIVVIGGSLMILLMTRIFQPVLIYLCHRGLRLSDAARNGAGG